MRSAATRNPATPIKAIRIDQGRTHAEKRSNHVRSPLIDGRGGRAGGALRAARAGARRGASGAGEPERRGRAGAGARERARGSGRAARVGAGARGVLRVG
ncbi:hypothetical protein Pa4123_60680 [Phytohabitans aurantiacus]|uniref:Uncharacterized protein n=1 Tax=Phytohabitans aurantiacus TaxID=3016789 RepID=A0ABQ5R4I0_9ACTN|nr:hypothetical protein Pa4123_60680 [Phytohabitans aurantiacus]